MMRSLIDAHLHAGRDRLELIGVDLTKLVGDCLIFFTHYTKSTGAPVSSDALPFQYVSSQAG
jgi:hypothetical protein